MIKKGAKMTLEQLETEKKCLLEFREWLEEKLAEVDIDLACNQQEAEDILNDMEATNNAGC